MKQRYMFSRTLHKLQPKLSALTWLVSSTVIIQNKTMCKHNHRLFKAIRFNNKEVCPESVEIFKKPPFSNTVLDFIRYGALVCHVNVTNNIINIVLLFRSLFPLGPACPTRNTSHRHMFTQTQTVGAAREKESDSLLNYIWKLPKPKPHRAWSCIKWDGPNST